MPMPASRVLHAVAPCHNSEAHTTATPRRVAETERLVHALSLALENWSACPTGHARRVCRLALALGREFHLEDGELTILRHGALLHDLGKLGVSEQTLLQTTPLSPQQHQELRRHPKIGAELLQQIGMAEPVRRIVHQHHEWYDGRGYPQGLMGEEIDFCARLLAVADAYDAMTSDRPYRRARPQEEALEQLRLRSGSQFDPLVVRALLELAEDLPGITQPPTRRLTDSDR